VSNERAGALRGAIRVVALAMTLCAIVASAATDGPAAPLTSLIRTIDLTNTPISGLARSFAVTVYRDSASHEKRPLVVLIPQLGARISGTPYAQQAEYFVKRGYVVAIPHLTGVYNDGRDVPVFDARMDADLVADTTPFAVEVLAAVADLSGSAGLTTANHVVIGEGLGSIVAARYAALGTPGCRGIVLVSPGFGPKRSTMSSIEDMRASASAFTQLGEKVALPSLWLYAKDNKRVLESTADDLFAAYRSANPVARLVKLPAIGMDGDLLFSKADPQTTWAEPVSAFLQSIQLN